MRILLVNKFYYPRGGDCIYTINLETLLREKRHDVAIFSMQHPKNLHTSWQNYFPSEVEFRMGRGIFDSIQRPFGTSEVIEKFKSLLDAFRPDVVHLNNIHSQLSPVVGELAHQKGCKVIWTLHDYKLLCPRYDCRRNAETNCHECFSGGGGERPRKTNVIKHRCMKDSFLASLIAYRESCVWNRERLQHSTDCFICPSQFMKDMMSEGGFDESKLFVRPNFIDVEKCDVPDFEKEDYYCYVGRLTREKGLLTLVEAANQLPYLLYIVGSGPLEQELRSRAKEHVKILGQKNWEELKEIERKARFSVIPSEWYENNPLSVIESMCLGTPILGARIGGIPELIDEGRNGMLFESGDYSDLKDKITKMMNAEFDFKSVREESILSYGFEPYYRFLMDLYS